MAEISERVNASLQAQEKYLNLHLPVLARAAAVEAFPTAAHLRCEEAEAELPRLQPDRFPNLPSRRIASVDGKTVRP